MDITRLQDPSSPLSLECPHCGHAEADDFEVVDRDTLEALRCAECSAAFHCAVMECRSCGAECFFSWTRRPPQAEIDGLCCPACGQNYVEDESPSLGTDLEA